MYYGIQREEPQPPKVETVTLFDLTETEAKMICLMAYRSIPTDTPENEALVTRLRDLARDLDFDCCNAKRDSSSNYSSYYVSSTHVN